MVRANDPGRFQCSDVPRGSGASAQGERAIAEKRRLVTDAEALQEILHRYVAIRRRDAIQPCFEVLLEVVDEVLPVDLDIVERARDIVIGHPELTARDGVHLAVMRENGIEEILSFNRHFDGLPGIVRLS
jgi:predicted nucleic acid-binding protein